jgi:hypothetical protein
MFNLFTLAADDKRERPPTRASNRIRRTSSFGRRVEHPFADRFRINHASKTRSGDTLKLG